MVQQPTEPDRVVDTHAAPSRPLPPRCDRPGGSLHRRPSFQTDGKLERLRDELLSRVVWLEASPIG
eukprot:1679821-Pyramimonas_sp.AAC.1